MICQKCKAEGKKSRVNVPMGGFSTCMAWQNYYDEDGKYHHHDPNSHSSTYSCSEGHRWHVTTYSQCFSCDFNEGRDTVTYDESLR
jgi:hypothetical protein